MNALTLEMLNEGATVKDVFAKLDECLNKDSTFENAYFLKAYVFYKLEAFEDAILEYNKVLRINPYHEEALKNRSKRNDVLFRDSIVPAKSRSAPPESPTPSS